MFCGKLFLHFFRKKIYIIICGCFFSFASVNNVFSEDNVDTDLIGNIEQNNKSIINNVQPDATTPTATNNLPQDVKTVINTANDNVEFTHQINTKTDDTEHLVNEVEVLNQKNHNANIYNDNFEKNVVINKQSKKTKQKVKFNVSVKDVNETSHGTAVQNLKEAYSCFNEGQYELAVMYYKMALAENMQSVEAQFGLGVAYQMLMQYDQAIEAYLKLLSKNFSRKKVVANLLLALSHKPYKDALDILLSIDEQIAGYSDILSQIGIIYMKTDDESRAISAFVKAYELSPNNSIVAYNLGILYDKQKNIDYAKHFYDQAIKNDILDILDGEDGKKLQERLQTINNQILHEVQNNKK